MNPYSFNVELYHKKFSSNPDPRDLLSPTVSSRPPKTRSLLKLLGTLANQKTCAVVAGVIVAAGSIHMVREVESAADHREKGTQTEVPESQLLSVQGYPLPNNASNIAETCKSGKIHSSATAGRSLSAFSSTDRYRSQLTEVASTEELDSESPLRNEKSMKTIASGCQCSGQKRAGRHVSQRIQPMHPCCQFSIWMALLALQKASSCETRMAISHVCAQKNARQKEDASLIGKNSLFHPGTKPAGTNLKDTDGNRSIKLSFPAQSSVAEKTSDSNVSTDTRNWNMSEAQKQAAWKTNVAGSSAEKPKQGSNLQ